MKSLSLLPAFAGVAMAGGKWAASTGPDLDDLLNYDLMKDLLYVWVGFIVLLTIFTFYRYTVRYIRTVACLNNDTQRYFNKPNYIYSVIRRQFLDAPLFRTRHHREFKLSTAINIGTLPSRMQTLFILGYVVASIVLTTVYIDWSKPTVAILGQLIKRTGYMATMNMIPLFLLAGRNNPLIVMTGITFDTYNLIHRWLGRIVAAEAIVHGLGWVFEKEMTEGWPAVSGAIQYSTFILTGVVAGAAFTLILFQSPGPIRHAFYEFFLYLHILLVLTAVVALWLHLEYFPVPKRFLEATIALWAYDRAMRLFSLVYRNIGKGGSKAEVELLPGDAVRVTMHMARPWHFRPGQHAYIYMPAIGFWTSHPFTVAWSEIEGAGKEAVLEEFAMGDPEKGMANATTTNAVSPTSSNAAANQIRAENAVMNKGKETISFIIRRRTGFTNKLFRKADRAPGGKLITRAFVEGPYGSQSLHSYGTVLLFAAGVGITHQVPHVRDLVSGFNNGTVAARKVTLVWIIQSPEHLEWIRPWMTQILGLPRRRDVLRILLFVTRPRSMKEIHSPSSSVQMFPGKPNIQALVDQECENAIGSIGVSVCGVGALADDVRRASRNWMGRVNIEFEEESFSW